MSQVNEAVRAHRGALAVWLWAAVLAAVVCAPWLRPGYLLAYDMVWVPHLDLTRLEVWGLGSALPRAVPSDAVAALAGSILPAAVVQRVVLAGVFVLGAVGAARLVPTLPLPARLATATFFVWNPFVAERLALGQWPLLIGLAALPWLIVALLDISRRRNGMVVAALAGLAMSPAGGLIAVPVVLVLGRTFGRYRLVGLVAALNAPWIVAGLLHRAAATSDPAGVTAFAVQSDGPLGRLWSAMSLGGIWNADVVPGSRALWTTAVLVAFGWVVMAVGVSRWWRDERVVVERLAVLALSGLVVACAGWWAPGLMGFVADTIPGGGLLRDGTRFLMLLIPLSAMALGHGAAVVAARVPRPSTRKLVAALLVVLPVVSVPDLAWGVDGRVQVATYPQAWADVRAEIRDSSAQGDLLVLPFSAYRAPSWNDGRPVLDPAGRYFDRTTVVNDDLIVSGITIRGEDPRAAAVFDVLAAGVIEPAALRARGIGLVLIDVSAPEAAGALTSVARLQLVASSGDLVLFSAGDAIPDGPTGVQRWSMILAWIVAVATVAGAAVAEVVYRGRRRKTGRGK